MKQATNKKPDDLVFGHISDGQKSSEDIIMKYYNQLRKEMLEPAGLGHVDIYSQRHAFITDRLRAGANLVKIAEHCGTSPRMISQTYSHITGLESSKEMLEKTHTFSE
ncbi:MAG: hypothetical protein ACREP9_06935, partial [Candidatus Dormibacteraceae bacterium]